MGRAVTLLAVAVLSWGSPASADSVVIVVNKANPVSSLSRTQVADLYFKRTKQWPDGTAVRFIDMAAGSPERKTLLNDLLRRSSSEVDSYWIGQKLYRGDSAPLQVLSGNMVLQFVAAFPGAIGYVSASTPVTNASVKVIPFAEGRD